jgi:TnpA family transposase
MLRRSLLSNEQRTRLFAVPVDHAEMAKHYALGANDLAPARQSGARTTGWVAPSNSASCKYPGLGIGLAEQPPEAMIAFAAARQLGVRHVDFASYPRRDQTRREHAVELQRYLGLWSFGLTDWRECSFICERAASCCLR